MPSLSQTVARVKAHFAKSQHADIMQVSISGKGKNGKTTTTTSFDGKDKVLRTSTDATAEHAEFTSAAAAAAHLLEVTKPKKASKARKTVGFSTKPIEVHTYEHPADYHYDFRVKKEEYKALQKQYGDKIRCEGLCKKRRAEKMKRELGAARAVVTIDDLGYGKEGYEKVEWRNNPKRMKVAGSLFM